MVESLSRSDGRDSLYVNNLFGSTASGSHGCQSPAPIYGNYRGLVLRKRTRVRGGGPNFPNKMTPPGAGCSGLLKCQGPSAARWRRVKHSRYLSFGGLRA